PRGPLLRILVLVGSAYLAWFWAVQNPRYGLPIAVLSCAVAGAGSARVDRLSRGAVRLVVAIAVPALALLGLISYLVAALPGPGLPWRTVLGLEARTAYLGRIMPEYAVLPLLDAEPGPKRVAANADSMPQIYSKTPLNAVL